MNLLCLLVFFSLAACNLSTATGTRVTKIIDGDTIEVSTNGVIERVSYIGIDTPERGKPYYQESTAANRRLIEGKQVVLVKDISERDRYGRLLRYVYADGVFVNAELVREGYAQVTIYPPDVKYACYFLQLQREARDAGRGLWGVANVT